jgi:hypothetical protein
VRAGKLANGSALTPQQVEARLRAEGLVTASNSLKPIAEWSAQQLCDMVKFWRYRSSIRVVRASYADEASFCIANRLVTQLSDAFADESDCNPDLAAHFC